MLFSSLVKQQQKSEARQANDVTIPTGKNLFWPEMKLDKNGFSETTMIQLRIRPKSM